MFSEDMLVKSCNGDNIVTVMAVDSWQLGNLVTVNLILAKVNLKWDFSRVKFVNANFSKRNSNF